MIRSRARGADQTAHTRGGLTTEPVAAAIEAPEASTMHNALAETESGIGVSALEELPRLSL